MAEPKPVADLVTVSLEALDRYEARQEALAGDKARRPAPGEVYVLRETRDYDVEWVLVAHDPASPERYLAVPADANFLKGSADVALADGSSRLRSRFAVWIDGRILDSELLVGTVSEDDVKQARQRWLDVGDGKSTGSALAREVDRDPEYQDWCEDVLTPARRKLVEASKQVRGDAPGVVVPFRRSARFTASRIAASVALVVTGGLALQLWRLNARAQNLEVENRIVEERYRGQLQVAESERDRLQADRGRLEEAHRLEMEQAGERVARQYRDRIAALDQRLEEAWGAADVVNPAIAIFDAPGMTARGKKELTLSPGSSHAVLFFALRERSPASRYRLVLRERGDSAVIWMNDRLMLEKPGEIRVGLPATHLKQGRYDLELARLEAGAFKKVADYELTILAGSGTSKG